MHQRVRNKRTDFGYSMETWPCIRVEVEHGDLWKKFARPREKKKVLLFYRN